MRLRGLLFTLTAVLAGIIVTACPCRAQLSLSSQGLLEAAVPGYSKTTSDNSHRVKVSTSSTSHILSFSFPVGRRQSINIETELVRFASFNVKLGGYYEKPDWRFKAVPLTIGYERSLVPESRRIVPVVGAGLSYYVSNLRQRVHSPDGSAYFQTGMGLGYGGYCSAGFRAKVVESAYVQIQSRYRIVDGLGLAGRNPSSARFDMFDFVVGIGFNL